MFVLLSRTQAGPVRTVKQEQEEISRNLVQTFSGCSVGPDHFYPFTISAVHFLQPFALPPFALLLFTLTALLVAFSPLESVSN